MLGLKDAALAAGVAESTIYRAAKNGKLSATSGNSGQLLFDPSEIDRWVSTRAERASASAARTVTSPTDSVDYLRKIERLEADLAAERRRNVDLERDRERWHDVATGALRQLAAERSTSTPARQGFWQRVFG